MTVAARQAALDAGNRERAAASWRTRDEPLTPGVNAARVWAQRPVADLRARLGDRLVTVWAEGDVFHVLWRGEADRVDLAGSIQLPLWRVGTSDLWELSVRVRDLDRAVLEVAVLPQHHDTPGCGGSLAAEAAWRGAKAPPAPPRANPLRGDMDHHEFRVRSLGGARRVSVYRPPGRHPGRLPVVYQADGGGRRYAEVVEAAIDDGLLPPLLLVGIEPGGLSGGRDRRADEYIHGMHRRRFAGHERFVLDTVIPWVQARHGATADRAGTVVAGCSNGAAWALTMAHRHPGRFGAVAAFSVAGSDPRRVVDRLDGRVRHHLVVGTLEVDGINRTRDWADGATAAGCEVVYHERIAGHDMCSWTEELPGALAWTITTNQPPQPRSAQGTLRRQNT